MFRGERKWLVSETRVLLDGTRLELRRMKEEIVALREEMWAAAGGAAPGGTGGRGRGDGDGPRGVVDPLSPGGGRDDGTGSETGQDTAASGNQRCREWGDGGGGWCRCVGGRRDAGGAINSSGSGAPSSGGARDMIPWLRIGAHDGRQQK